MKKRKAITVALPYLLSMGLFCFNSCAKEWLDVRSDKSIVVPATLQDADAILNNNSVLNISCPNLGEISADDYIATEIQLESATPWEMNAYTWSERVFVDETGTNNWNSSYQKIYYANLALEVAEQADKEGVNLNLYKSVVGRAKFFRALSYYQLAQVFCLPYSVDNHDALGLPLREISALESVVQRANLQDTYNFIVRDLREAMDNLPETVEYQITPSKPATYALLARVYLLMDEFEKAFLYADSCLQMHGFLADYRSLDPSANFPFKRFNEEVLFDCSMAASNLISGSRINVSADLLNLYDEDDLRTSLFFRENNGIVNFRGSYYGSNTHFAGLATDEVYLIKAESALRTGRSAIAQTTLSYFAEKRTEEQIGETEMEDDELLERILLERRKQLVFRGIRWSDIKRLNRDPSTEKILYRDVNGKPYMLAPHDNRFALPIPDLAIELSGYKQNDRKN